MDRLYRFGLGLWFGGVCVVAFFAIAFFVVATIFTGFLALVVSALGSVLRCFASAVHGVLLWLYRVFVEAFERVDGLLSVLLMVALGVLLGASLLAVDPQYQASGVSYAAK